MRGKSGPREVPRNLRSGLRNLCPVSSDVSYWQAAELGWLSINGRSLYGCGAGLPADVSHFAMGLAGLGGLSHEIAGPVTDGLVYGAPGCWLR